MTACQKLANSEAATRIRPWANLSTEDGFAFAFANDPLHRLDEFPRLLVQACARHVIVWALVTVIGALWVLIRSLASGHLPAEYFW
jgi:hypothetical protein